jgi:N-acyl-phosphatidylethanolamine-hydrolysing phospholipase D
LDSAKDASAVSENADKIKATWLGHACFLVELPATAAGLRGARILFDPVFSDRCSPSQWIGPKRFTRLSCLYFLLVFCSYLSQPHRAI